MDIKQSMLFLIIRKPTRYFFNKGLEMGKSKKTIMEYNMISDDDSFQIFLIPFRGI